MKKKWISCLIGSREMCVLCFMNSGPLRLPAAPLPPGRRGAVRGQPRSMLPESDGKHGFAASDGVVLSHFQQPCSL